MSIGTSSRAQPAASLPVAALERGAVVVEINPDITPLTARATHALHGQTGQGLFIHEVLTIESDYDSMDLYLGALPTYIETRLT